MSYTPKTQAEVEFELILDQYRKVIARLKNRAVAKYGPKAEEWFGL